MGQDWEGVTASSCQLILSPLTMRPNLISRNSQQLGNGFPLKSQLSVQAFQSQVENVAGLKDKKCDHFLILDLN